MTRLPDALTERARLFLEGGVAATTPRDAATVVLLRDGARGLEVYLLRRATTMAFAAGMHVFPGGAVDPRDGELSPAWSGPPDEDWAAALGCDPALARALVCAAVRETFEESGVLLAGGPEEVVPDTTGADWEADRQGLLDRSQSLAEVVERRGLVVRSDLLRPWAHWVTPEFEPRRFDTRFFLAAVPQGQRARDISGEADQAVWLPVPDAIAGHERGEHPMLPPTIVTLRELATYVDVADVLAVRAAVVPIVPRPVLVGDEVRLVVDGPGGALLSDADLVRRRP